jgi:hypothetical protein
MPPKPKPHMRSCWINAREGDNTQTKASACSNCFQVWHKGARYWSSAAATKSCLHTGKTPEQREEEAGATLGAREHVHEPQATRAPAEDFRSPQPQKQARLGGKGISPTDGGGAAGMSLKAATLLAVAAAGSADVPMVLELGKGSIRGKVADKSKRRQRDVGAAMECGIRGLAAAVAPDDPEGALQAGYARLNGTLTERARAQVKEAEAHLKAAAAEVAVSGGKRKRAAATRTERAAAGALAEARALLLSFEATKDGATASKELMENMAAQVWDSSRELWSFCISERLPGAVLAPRGSGMVLWKVLSRVITMMQVVGTKSVFRPNGEGRAVWLRIVCATAERLRVHFPLTIVPKLRICIAHSKRFQDRQGVSSQEPLRMRYTDACVSHNRRPKCMTLLPLEL